MFPNINIDDLIDAIISSLEDFQCHVLDSKEFSTLVIELKYLAFIIEYDYLRGDDKCDFTSDSVKESQ